MRVVLVLVLLLACGRTELSASALDAGPVTPECAARPVDLLLAVDASGSMVDEIRELADQIDTLMNGLVRPPDRDGDGIADWPAVQDLNFAVTSTELAGAFETVGRGEGCDAEYSPVHRYRRGEDIESFIRGARCVSTPDTRDRAGEALFSATFRALLPEGTAYPIDGPLGDTTNAGFLRPGSLLVIVLLSDEDDRSRCWRVPCSRRSFEQRAREHAYAFRLLRRPEDLIMTVVVGLPEGVSDPEEILRVSRESHDSAHICRRFTRTALAAPHFIGVALYNTPVLESVCSPDWSAIAERLAARVGGELCVE